MKDTTTEIDNLLRRQYKELSNKRRLEIVSSMFETAKTIIKASILNSNPNISKTDLKIQIFLRLYKNDFDENTKKRIVKHLKMQDPG